MKRTFPLALLLLASAATTAKLPPLSDEAKAKAAEAAAKAAHGNKMAEHQLCQRMNKVAAQYQVDAKKAGKAASAPVATPACADPGAFSYTPPADIKPPLEAAGAHSPPKTAAAPPSTNTPAAAMPVKK